MNYSDYRFTLDVQIHQAQVSVPVTLNDTARRLCIGLTDGRKPYTIADGCQAAFVAKKPDGLGLCNECAIENNTIIYEFTPDTTNVVGTYECEIRLYNDNGLQLTSPQFLLVVDEGVTSDDTIIDSHSEATILNQIITQEKIRVANEEKRQEAEEERIDVVDFFKNRGGIVISEEEPVDDIVHVWLDPTLKKDEISLLESTDIVHELSDAEDKIPSVKLLNEVANQQPDTTVIEAYVADAQRAKEAAEGILGDSADTYSDNTVHGLCNETKRLLEEGDLASALDEIIEIQDSYIAGDYPPSRLLDVYPVGSIYMSVNDTDPQTLFGGTWERLKDSFLLGAGDTYQAGDTGGSADAVIVEHDHFIFGRDAGATATDYVSGRCYVTTYVSTGDRPYTLKQSANQTDQPINGVTSKTGVSGVGKNMPPYLAVYMWKRTA